MQNIRRISFYGRRPTLTPSAPILTNIIASISIVFRRWIPLALWFARRKSFYRWYLNVTAKSAPQSHGPRIVGILTIIGGFIGLQLLTEAISSYGGLNIITLNAPFGFFLGFNFVVLPLAFGLVFRTIRRNSTVSEQLYLTSFQPSQIREGMVLASLWPLYVLRFCIIAYFVLDLMRLYILAITPAPTQYWVDLFPGVVRLYIASFVQFHVAAEIGIRFSFFQARSLELAPDDLLISRSSNPWVTGFLMGILTLVWGALIYYITTHGWDMYRR